MIDAEECGIRHVPWVESSAMGGGQVNGSPCRVDACIVDGIYPIICIWQIPGISIGFMKVHGHNLRHTVLTRNMAVLIDVQCHT